MSNNIKQKISDNIVDPAAKSRSTTTIIGEVLDSNEFAYTCKVRFNNANGTSEIREAVEVLTYNKSIIDWFPVKGDRVMLSQKGNDIIITGPGDSGAKQRTQIKLQNDIYSDTINDSMGGYIF